jgi:surfactin synthase thioesterase subunit
VMPQEWLRFFADRGGPAGPDAPVLVCLPHAGGSASAYFDLSVRSRPAVEVCAVQYPGRLDRRSEPAVLSVAELADRLAEVVGPLAARLKRSQRSYALFGHSMGAVVAYELALRLESGSTPGPTHLFASARRAPSRTRPEDLHRGSDADLLAHIGRLGGITPDLLADPEMRALILPVLRADYTAIERYRAEPGRTVRCPVTVLVGDRDPMVDAGEAADWARHTRGGFEMETFAGGHFYLADHLPAVVSVVAGRLAAQVRGGEGAAV